MYEQANDYNKEMKSDERHTDHGPSKPEGPRGRDEDPARGSDPCGPDLPVKVEDPEKPKGGDRD